MNALVKEQEAPLEEIKKSVIDALKTIYDPEIPVNIYDLGLIYSIDMDAAHRVTIKMTLTAPACPVAGILPNQVKQTIEKLADIQAVEVHLVWDPPWTPDRMSEEAQLALGLI